MIRKINHYFQLLAAHPAWSLIAAFGTYFCMYGFRKPYTAATFSSFEFWGLNYKVLLVVSQTIGYLIAKWIGIKIISEIKPHKRIGLLLMLIAFAELMLFFFGLVAPPFNIMFLFLNGLPLGIVFGLILSFLEGRKNSEALIAGLCASFIVSDGFSKSVGTALLLRGVSESWMPFLSGAIFTGPILLFIFMLNKVPPPTTADAAARTKRLPMTREERRTFFARYAPGIVGITLAYLFVTFLRSIRADFAPELWRDLGFAQTPTLFTQSELIISFCILLISGLTIYIQNHVKAFEFSLYSCIGGFIICLLAVMSLYLGLDKFLFMVLIGLGIYIPYVAIHTTVFERMIAATHEKANIGFLMYIADSVGYTGYALLLLFRSIWSVPGTMLHTFINLTLLLGFAGVLITLFIYGYFRTLLHKRLQYE